MEVRLSNDIRDRPLSLSKIIRGILCLFVLLTSAFFMIVYVGFFTAVVLRIFSIHYSRQTTAFFFGKWLTLWCFLFEKINKTKVVFSGETLPPNERIILVANHRTEVDWMYLWNLAIRKNRLGFIRYVLKSSLMKLPVFGWGFLILEFIPVERKWELDEAPLRKMLKSFRNSKDPLWLVVFPEGTDFTEKKRDSNQVFAKQNGLPEMSNVLLPKAKGFHACLSELTGCVDAVYDLTIGYKFRSPSLMDNVFGVAPTEVHVDLRRVPVREIGPTEKECGEWLMGAFIRKDEMLSGFYRDGSFSEVVDEGNLTAFEGIRSFVLVGVLVSVSVFLTFFCSVWFKVYVVLVCGYLSLATSFNFRPYVYLQ